MHPDTHKISCLIVDDEPLAQEVLTTHIARIPSLQVVQVCNNAMEAFEALHKNEIDLIFLDINMPVISGLNFLSSLKDPPAVIFTTAYTEYAIDGFELDAVDYLLKPISFQRLSKAIDKALSKLSQQGRNITVVSTEVQDQQPLSLHPSSVSDKQYIFVKADNKLVKVDFDDILYIEGMKDYLKMHLTAGKPVIVHQTMKGMEAQLPATQFMRVHKSFIVSLSAIRAIEGNMIHLEKTQLPIGSTFKDALLNALSPDN